MYESNEGNDDICTQCGICGEFFRYFFDGLAHLHDAHNHIPDLPPSNSSNLRTS